MENDKIIKKAGSQAGLTMIEFLVVIAIVVIILAVLMVAINNFQARSRDDKRVVEIKALQDALAIYQIHIASYPLPDQAEPLVVDGEDALSSVLINEKAMSSAIHDPVAGPKENINYVYTYQSVDSGKSYLIKYCLETSAIKDRQQGCGNEASP